MLQKDYLTNSHRYLTLLPIKIQQAIAVRNLFKTVMQRLISISVVKGAAIAQWICLILPSCRPGFDSQACHLRFFSFIVKFVLYLSMRCEKRTKIKKRPGLAHLFLKKRISVLIHFVLKHKLCNKLLA